MFSRRLKGFTGRRKLGGMPAEPSAPTAPADTASVDTAVEPVDEATVPVVSGPPVFPPPAPAPVSPPVPPAPVAPAPVGPPPVMMAPVPAQSAPPPMPAPTAPLPPVPAAPPPPPAPAEPPKPEKWAGRAQLAGATAPGQKKAAGPTAPTAMMNRYADAAETRIAMSAQPGAVAVRPRRRGRFRRFLGVLFALILLVAVPVVSAYVSYKLASGENPFEWPPSMDLSRVF
jgi:hypothetical protein